MKNLKNIQIISKIIQFLSTKQAVKFAFKLFTTPIKLKETEREETLRASAQNKKLYIDEINKEIEVLEYGYSPKRVLLIHGWGGRATQFYLIADKLLENGFMVISFDAPGHGKSEGKNSNLMEFIAIIKHLHIHYNGFHSAIGHSLGGLALFNTAPKMNLKNIATISAADKISDVVQKFIKNIGLKAKTTPKFIKYLEKKFAGEITNYDASTNAKHLKIPVLIIHDKQDKEVCSHSAENINKNLKNGTLQLTDGLGHTRILINNDVANKVVDFIKKTNEI